MEDMKPPYSSSNPTPSTPSPTLAMHKSSHVISKSICKPKIRIIHIFAPQIINTDVANFRELVQRLTGNKAAAEGRKKTTKLPSRDLHGHVNKTMQLHDGFRSSLLRREKITEEENENETCCWADTSTSFIEGFTDNLDAFIRGLIK